MYEWQAREEVALQSRELRMRPRGRCKVRAFAGGALGRRKRRLVVVALDDPRALLRHRHHGVDHRGGIGAVADQVTEEGELRRTA